MPGHADIIYGRAARQMDRSSDAPVLEWRPIHVDVCKRLRRIYGLPLSQANSAVVAFRVQIMAEQDDGNDADTIAHIIYRLLRYRGEV